MAKQIGPSPSALALEQRVAVLERQIATLTVAARLLASALEGTPLDSPDGEPAARQAHTLLLLPPLAPADPH
ncbi:hypothetical protein HUT06_25865 [Actinomadura sp. NAK00032]|uniref:hypothetical protein n=1 Tax=Actinomadura sp. NAK00032 TaxID=2742128 RepID=UPI00159040C3|nr:hypothetical protein [Actinomadura sp. NAK00032]QKW37016.1 hypothetical protein HUT06_25865 [Actinomadura sp. NAK00032]